MSHNVSQLDIKDLHATIDGKEILKGVDFQVKQGEIHAVMGPNGSGKSTLASTVMGHPKYIVTKGDILFDHESILKLAPDVRARKGLDRKSTRLNSSHSQISYAVFCLKKKK